MAKGTERWLGEYDNAKNEELAALSGEIVDGLVKAFDEGGVAAPYKKELVDARETERKIKGIQKHEERMQASFEKAKRRYRERYNETVEYYKASLALDRLARSIRDKKLRTFENATEIGGDALVGLIGELSRFEYRQTFTPSAVREKVGELLKWYNPDNPMLTVLRDEEGKAYGGVDFYPEVQEALESLANGEGNMTADDLKTLHGVLSYFVHFIENYNKVFYQGKWVDAEPYL